MFKLKSGFQPTGDQPEAISKLEKGLRLGLKQQVLLGVTGSGKTYTIANVIARTQKTTLVISPNKTLAAQLYQEFRDFFPDNAVSYFVSYYDYYQPEAYLPQNDTYIEKETEINDLIDKLRLEATTNLMTRQDVIVVASVSCIYNLGSPQEYQRASLTLSKGSPLTRKAILERLIDLRYDRQDYDFRRGGFRTRGPFIDIFPAYADCPIRINVAEDKIIALEKINPLSGQTAELSGPVVIYPAKHYLVDPGQKERIFAQIREDLRIRIAELKTQGKLLEANRLNQRTNYDLETIKEFGYVNGIENYSRYFDGRAPGEPPYPLLDFFPSDYLLVIDESHLAVPQIQGMYAGDKSRKKNLIEYGFRLPSALDNRPLQFNEFFEKTNQIIYMSATPASWEINQANKSVQDLPKTKSKLIGSGVVEQLIRPTGLIDPRIEVRPVNNQVADLLEEINNRVAKGDRVLVTTLTKRMAEELSDYLAGRGLKTNYLHSEVATLSRSDILDDLRSGTYDVIVGINLLREGLDLPEVSLVAILDADKEGFLRSETSLVQTMGRAARHIQGTVIMYADTVTGSMQRAINEVKRRRRIQLEYNRKHHIRPQTITKPIRSKIIEKPPQITSLPSGLSTVSQEFLNNLDPYQLTPVNRRELLKRIRRLMNQAAQELDFETAAVLRDKAQEIKTSLN